MERYRLVGRNSSSSLETLANSLLPCSMLIGLLPGVILGFYFDGEGWVVPVALLVWFVTMMIAVWFFAFCHSASGHELNDRIVDRYEAFCRRWATRDDSRQG